jgi:DNA-directed RNA polymerase subunit K
MVILMNYTRFEKARIVGARALQISLGAPILLKREEFEGMIDPVDIAMKEYDEGVIPITVTKD